MMTTLTIYTTGSGLRFSAHLKRVLAAASVILLLTAASANATVVSGVYAGSHDTPLGAHQLHFDNLISGDIFMARTGPDGAFAVNLPPGTYDLRAEHGAVVKSKIVVNDAAVSLGHVGMTMPLEMILRPFQRQSVAPSIVGTSAPATAHLSVTATGTGSSVDGTSSQAGATFYTPGSAAPVPPPPPAQ